MKPKLSPNYPSTGVLVFIICSGLFLFVVGVSNVTTVREGLSTGQVYSAGVVIGFDEKVHRDASPIEYWTLMGIYSLACVGSIGLGICVPFANIRAYIRKLARQKRERAMSASIGDE